MGNNPSKRKGSQNPVETVNWEDAQAFCQKAGNGLRLPSEAEWEYACRAGSREAYCFGDDESQLGAYAWYLDNGNRQPHPVGQKKPNAWGLYDMLGNAYEWCQDGFHTDYTGAPADGSAWEKSPSVSYRVLRGGDGGSFAKGCRSAARTGYAPSGRSDGIGFRVALVR